jgi:hypothetical protein
MPAGHDPDGPEGVAPPKLTLGQRVLLILPRVRREKTDERKEPIGDWMRRTFLKPEDPDAVRAKAPGKPQSIEELETLVRYADDKERAIGLVAAPLAAAIGFLVIHALVVNDPGQHLKNGKIDPNYVNPHYVSVSLYDDLFLVLIVLAVLMLAMAMLRKRLYLGIVTALYGLSIFNLHYWGFGVPFLICGSWYLVRAYRLHRDLKLATGEPSRFGSRAGGDGTSYTTPPEPNKRYTPPSASSGRAVRPKPENGKKAG